MTPRPPLNELLALFRATVAREGVTTGAGNIAGNTIIDAGLAGVGVNSFISMLIILYPGDFNNVDSADVTVFDNANGEITFDHPYKNVAAAIPIGVPYKIVTFRFVPAEVAALTALVNAIETKLDTPANFMADLTTLETRLSAARALLLDEITALRMAELDPGNIPADIDTLLTRVTAAVALASVCTELRLAELDPANIPADTDPKVMGRSQIAATTIDLFQAANTYVLFTGADQVVILESLNIKLPTGAIGGTITGITIQTDDATPGVIISAANGAVANLLTEADLFWTGSMYITVGTTIGLTIVDGPAGAEYICQVTAKYRAVVAGGNLT